MLASLTFGARFDNVRGVARVSIIVVMLGGVLLAQWLAVLPVVPHAPLHDCAQHQCGCPADLTARKACCCFPDSASLVETLLRPTGCEPGQKSFSIFSFHWVLDLVSDARPVEISGQTISPVTPTPRSWTRRPAVPPPRLLPVV